MHDLPGNEDIEDNIDGDNADGPDLAENPFVEQPLLFDEADAEKAWRDTIAEGIWNDYQQILQERGQAIEAGSDGGRVDNSDGCEMASDEEDENE